MGLPVVDSEGIRNSYFRDVMDVAEGKPRRLHKGAAVTPLRTSYQETIAWELYKNALYGYLL